MEKGECRVSNEIGKGFRANSAFFTNLFFRLINYFFFENKVYFNEVMPLDPKTREFPKRGLNIWCTVPFCMVQSVHTLLGDYIYITSIDINIYARDIS